LDLSSVSLLDAVAGLVSAAVAEFGRIVLLWRAIKALNPVYARTPMWPE